ncbi:hypothetical protein IC620_06215 [Hazenella sp. IB182357]|uniref:Uncharacterized protein n=1 Tax=Polycladospora coralii TaxID=2771432 RepID=A0A926RTP4_9BACL|nr:hypothetical protein [Polycladospora coralii]MBD1371953.1 hypothetical protein [Polycladospora coralii]
MGWLSKDQRENRREKKLDKLEKEYDYWKKEGDEKSAAYTHREIKDVRKKKNFWI